jgi:hypothetical protein
MIHKLLFPTLKDRRWGYVNFGEESRSSWARGVSGHRAAMVHSRLGIEFSFGGYMEDRSSIISYQKPGETWHLGIDYTVPAGTPVHLPVDAELHSFVVDTDQDGGWGGKAIFKTAKSLLIFGHLDGAGFITGAHKLGLRHKAGDFIATIADFDKNGGWIPHLHLQAVADRWASSAASVDGYSGLYDGIDKDFPRPDLVIQDLIAEQGQK